MIAFFGIELEFYITKNHQQFEFEEIKKTGIIEKIKNTLTKKFDNFFYIKKEQGLGQFEITSRKSSNQELITKNINQLKIILIRIAYEFNFEINLEAQPFLEDCGNALQINFSLEKNGKNQFIKNGENESEIMLYSIAGILNQTNQLIKIAAPKKNDYLRYDLEINRKLFQNGKYCSPTKINWGYDNRTCLIRVAGKKYDKNRRIEYRLASNNTDIKKLINAIYNAAELGISNETKPPEAFYGNSFDKQYHVLKSLDS